MKRIDLTHESPTRHGQFSPDGTWVLTAEEVQFGNRGGASVATARVWSADTGTPQTPFIEHVGDCIEAVAFAPDSNRFLTATANGLLRVFSVSSGEVVGQWKARSGFVAAAWLRDGSAVVVAHKNKSLSIVDAESLQARATVRLPRAVEKLDVSPDGKSVAAAGGVSVFVVDVESAELRCTLTHRLKVRGVVWLTYNRLCSASYDYIVREWDTMTGEEIREVCTTQRWVFSMQCSQDRQRLLIGTEDQLPWQKGGPGSGHAQVFDLASGEPVGPRMTHSRASENACTVFAAFSPDERLVATGSADRTVALWNPETGEQLWQDEYGWMVFGIEFSPRGDRILAFGAPFAGLWDVSGEA